MYNSFAFEERKGSDKEVRPSSKGGGNQNNDNKKGPFPPKFKGQGPNGENNMNQIFKTVLLWLVMIVGVYALIRMFNPGGDPNAVEISASYYQRLLTSDKIAKGEVEQYGLNMYRFHGTLRTKENLQPLKGDKPVMSDKFVTNLIPETLNDQNKLWSEKGIEITKQDSDSSWTTGILSFLPWIIIIGVWIMIMRRMQGGGGMNGPKGIFSFGKSKAKLLTEGATKVTFADVSGCDEAKVELHEVIEFLKEPQKFQRLGGKIPKGVLLLGPPGTGKTLLARAVAGEAGVPFLSISGADFVEMFVGVGASRVRDLFEQAKKNAPCIVFIDEIDAVGRHRGAGMGGGHDEREQTLNQLLVEMDGFEQNSGVIMIAATNRPDVLDPALLRPGRFDRQVVVDRPDLRGREGILKVHTRTVPLSADVDLNTLAKGTPGLSGADLANLVNEAALLAARRNGDRVTMLDFENAKDKVMMGVERKSVIISDEEKKITSYHECGHVLVAKKIPEADPVHKVTIIPRGRALGVTTYLLEAVS
jgi:cell division protease FtsH